VLTGNRLNIYQVRPCPPGTISHTIRAGDTVWALARQYGTTIEAILAANPGADPRNLRIGQRLCIPVPTPVCPPGSVLYTIQPGDSFWVIAQRLGISVDIIIALNPGVDPRRLIVGQQICVPAPPVPPPVPPVFVFPCTVPLLPLEPGPEPELQPGGSLWVREDEVFGVTQYPYMFAATLLPEPSALGNFDAYIGRVTIAQPPPDPPILHSVELTRVVRPVHQVTWAGTRIIPEGFAPTDVAEIRPFNTQTDIVGPAILKNTFQGCVGSTSNLGAW